MAAPKWQKISQAINHGGSTIGLPFIIVLDSDMTIKHIGANLNSAVQTISTATGIPYTGGNGGGGGGGSGTCQGKCGAQSTDCWCDDKCSGYGDCCKDICEICGIGC